MTDASKMSKIRHVACVLTGNLESAVAALLMRRKGYQVTGLYVHSVLQPQRACDAGHELAYATCSALDITLREITPSEDQWYPFLQAATADYQNGLSPNLTILYNQHFLCGSLTDYVFGVLGADVVATGHYARTYPSKFVGTSTHGTAKNKKLGLRLLKSTDQLNDDTYLLCHLSQKQLLNMLFPIGDLTGEVVQAIVKASPLKDLTKLPLVTEDVVQEEILFDRLSESLPVTNGKLLHVETKETIGYHKGLHLWKIGQKFVLDDQVYYVTEKNPDTYDIMVTEQADHPSMLCNTMFTSLANWTFQTPHHFYKTQMMDCEFRLQNRTTLQQGTLTVGQATPYCGNDHLILSSKSPHVVQPGNYVAFYQGEECIAGAKITKPGPSLYTMNYQTYNKNENKDKSKKSGLNKYFEKFLH